MQRKIFLISAVILVSMIAFTSCSNLRADVIGVYDLVKNKSQYTVSDLQFEKRYTANKYVGIVTGLVYKKTENINKPYVIVNVDFLDKDGEIVDKKSMTLDTAGINVGEKRSFEIKTDKEFETYRYYLK